MKILAGRVPMVDAVTLFLIACIAAVLMLLLA
jgi:hypothetical protein